MGWKSSYRSKYLVLTILIIIHCQPIWSLGCLDVLNVHPEVLKQLERHEKEWTQNYLTWSGFKSLKELKDTINENPELSGISEELETGEFEFAMVRNYNKRLNIKNDGFLTLFHTGTSSGVDYKWMRDNVELSHLLDRKSEYEKEALYQNPNYRPKYLFLRPKMKSRWKKSDPDYGKSFDNKSDELIEGDIYIFSENAVKKYITWSIGDSISRSIAPRIPNKDHYMNSWEGPFIPWKFIDLAAPLLREAFKHGGSTNMKKAMLDVLFNEGVFVGISDFSQYKIIKGGYSSIYIEVQCWLPELSLKHLKAFVFKSQAPSGEFLQSLLDNNVEIRDGRYEEEVIWNP